MFFSKNKKFIKPFRYKQFKEKRMNFKLLKGFYCLQSLENFYLKKEHLNSVIRVIKKRFKKEKYFIITCIS